jgi:hypothetical protein
MTLFKKSSASLLVKAGIAAVALLAPAVKAQDQCPPPGSGGCSIYYAGSCYSKCCTTVGQSNLTCEFVLFSCSNGFYGCNLCGCQYA